jgi:hypothetical protein
MKPPTHHKMVQKRHQEEISGPSDSTEAAATATELRALKRTRFQSSKAAENKLQRSLKDIPFQPSKSSKLTPIPTPTLTRNKISTSFYGSFPTAKHWDDKYFLEAIDNYTRRSVVFTRETRKDVAEQLFNWKKTVETQTERRLKAIRIDNARELDSRVQIWAKESRVEVQPTAAYTLSHNDVTERALQFT